MQKYTVELCLFGGAGDTIEVEAVDEKHARKFAIEIAEDRWEKGYYETEISLTEVTVSTSYLSPGQSEGDDKAKPESVPKIDQALAACRLLVRAYDNAAESESIKWEDLDYAYAAALAAVK